MTPAVITGRSSFCGETVSKNSRTVFESMRLLLFFLLPPLAFGGIAVAQLPGLPQGEARYNLVQANDGKTVGSADFSATTVPGGYEVSSRGEMHLQKFTYSFTNSNRLDGELNIVRDQLTGTVNGADVTFSLASDSTGRQFLINTAAGKTTQNSLDRHQHTVLLPDLDPAAYVEMVHFALEHPPTAWVVIPKQNGLLVPAEYDAQPDTSANFQGQPLVVHHTSVLLSGQNAISVEIYYRDDGALLEADLPEQNFYVIRDGFRLENRPHYVPPRNSTPPSGEQPEYPQGSAPPQYPPQQAPPAQESPQYSVPGGESPPQIQPQALLRATSLSGVGAAAA